MRRKARWTMKVELDLGDIFDSEQHESVSEIVLYELRAAVKAEVRKAIKADKELQGFIRSLHKAAVARAVSLLEGGNDQA
jgi:hypothetical protein